MDQVDFLQHVPLRNRLCKILVALSLLMLSACNIVASMGLTVYDSIQGKVLSGVSTFSCTSLTASLYKLDTSGKKITPALEQTEVNADGTYSFNGLHDLAIDVNDMDQITGPYVIEVTGCDQIYFRQVTSAQGQDVTFGSTLISYLLQTSHAQGLVTAGHSDVSDLLKKLASYEDCATAYAALIADPALTQEFQSALGVPPSVLLDATPITLQLSAPTALKEGTSTAFSVVAVHWSPTYNIVYLWKEDGHVISTSSNAAWTPGANTQGTHSLILYYGQDDGSRNVNLAKPFLTKSFVVQIANAQPATPPALSTPTLASQTAINVDIDTGPGNVNCASFSHLALTEDQVLPPAPEDFTIDCTQSGTQTLAYTLGIGDGTKTLRLWAIDASGNISATSSAVNVTLTTTPPVVHLTALPPGYDWRGGEYMNIHWTATDDDLTSQPISLFYSTDSGSSWIPIAANQANTGVYNWQIPSVTSTHMQLKVQAVDLGGHTAEDSSSVDFSVDSTPPSAPVVSLNSAAISSSRTITLGLTCDADFDGVFISAYSSVPGAEDLGWQSCAASMTYEVPTGDEVKTINVWTKDSAGNVSSTAGSVNFTLDGTNPEIHLTSFNSGSYRGGASSTMTWTATDTNWGSGTVHLEYSSDNGSSWSDIAAAAANNGSYAVTLPTWNSAQVRFRVNGCDLANNCAYDTSASAVTIDSTPPTVTSVSINDNAAYAGTVIVAVKSTLNDNLSSAGQMKIRTANANAITGDCQGQYADNSWQNYTDANTSVPHQLTPSDGVKKICVWAKDAAGNVSTISPSTGTDTVDENSIIFQVGNPPVISSFSLTRNSGGTIAAAGDAMTLSWSATDVEGLDNNPISFSYTTDNEVWKDIITNADVSVSSNITWSGSLSGNPTSGSGTITTWTAPTSSYFRVRITARDQAGNTSLSILSQTFNSGTWGVFAGSRDRGVGGGGTSASLYYGNPIDSVAAINPKTGDIYAVDAGYGLKKLDAKTGLVSTFLAQGANNLPVDGPLPANPTIYSSYADPHFDSQGRLYVNVAASYYSPVIYQIDLANSHARLYAGGGTNDDGGVAASSLRITGSVAFDDLDNMYAITSCGVPTYPYDQGKRVVKIAQNPDGTAGTTTRIIGDCTYATPTYGSTAYSSPAGAFPYAMYATIVPIDGGNTIYFANYPNYAWKIVNGKVYSVSLGSNSCGNSGELAYNAGDGKLYHSNSTCGLDQITPAGAQNGGETKTTLFAGNSTASGCTDEGVLLSNACTKMYQILSFNGTIYFTDGIGINSPSNYRLRYYDTSSKLHTVFGSLPFVGDGMDKAVMRSSFAGIYYKRSTESNLTAFPEGLYFMDSGAALFGRINAGTNSVNVLWGNQARKAGGYTGGDTISKDLSMGAPYSSGSAQALAFDSTGLPWMRADSQLFKVNASNQLEQKTAGSTYWSNLADGANPATSYMSVTGGSSNFTLKGQALFMLGAAYNYPGTDLNVSIRLLDFATPTTTRILGGTALYSESPLPSPDLSSGVAAAPLYYGCYYDDCFTQYDASTDRLYFGENGKMRYITTPSNTATSTLVTLFTANAGAMIYNFILNPTSTQIWYSTGTTTLYCHDISSAKSWCDDTTNHFTAAAAAGMVLNSQKPNIFTWKDDGTLLISTYGSEVLQFTLPTGP